MMIESLGLSFTGKIVMLAMLTAELGPKLVSGTHVGPSGLVVRKSVVFQMPPLAPPTYTVLPEGSEGSTAMALTWPALVGTGRRADRRPDLARNGIARAQGKDLEADSGVVTPLLSQPAGRQRLLEGQRPAVRCPSSRSRCS